MTTTVVVRKESSVYNNTTRMLLLSLLLQILIASSVIESVMVEGFSIINNNNNVRNVNNNVNTKSSTSISQEDGLHHHRRSRSRSNTLLFDFNNAHHGCDDSNDQYDTSPSSSSSHSEVPADELSTHGNNEGPAVSGGSASSSSQHKHKTTSSTSRGSSSRLSMSHQNVVETTMTTNLPQQQQQQYDGDDYQNENNDSTKIPPAPKMKSKHNKNKEVKHKQWIETDTFLSKLSDSFSTINYQEEWSFLKHLLYDETFPHVTIDNCNHNLTMYSDYDQQQIDSYWMNDLIPSLGYLHHDMFKLKLIYQALQVAYFAHRGQMRKSGEPFIMHPVQVASLLCGLKMDYETVMAGLLHDTVEDTDTTFEQLEKWFGSVVRTLVEGETKVSKLPKIASSFDNFDTDDTSNTVVNNAVVDEQAENLRQMFVAMTEDYRIIIIKLADRLHNMRTLRHMKPHKQIKISRETLDIFAPLAHRMGIWQFKSELEDTAFMYLYPNEYKRLNRKLHQHKKKIQDALTKSKNILEQQLLVDTTLSGQAEKVEVFGRTKELYSLWHKMETKKEHNLDDIVDVVALRVIITPKPPPKPKPTATTTIQQDQQQQQQPPNDFQSPFAAQQQQLQQQQQQQQQQQIDDSSNSNDDDDTDRGVWLCYHVLGLVQNLPGFQPVPTRVKDYISFPKPNGYQSLHTALLFNGQTIEVQIRTSTMHQVAEYGMASHWAYKDEKRRKQLLLSDRDDTDEINTMMTNDRAADKIYNTPWLSSIKEWSNDRISSRDFVDSVRRELLGKRVFVFLRNGKILNLSRGATAIDAAFQIHTEIGLNMHGVEINGSPVPFSYELRNGDVVSILTGVEGKPSLDWMRYAKSRSTRSKLRSYFRLKQKESYREAGKILIKDYLLMHGKLIQQEQRKNGIKMVISDIPSSIEELEKFVFTNTPTGSQKIKKYYEKMDDMLIDIGKQKQHDRSLLHKLVSKIFGVSSKTFIEAENNNHSIVANSVLAAVRENQQLAKDAAKAFTGGGAAGGISISTTSTSNNRHHDYDANNNDDTTITTGNGGGTGTGTGTGPTNPSITASSGGDGTGSSSTSSVAIDHGTIEKNNMLLNKFFTGIGCPTANDPEFADPEQLCTECLPVYGDEVVGTRPYGTTSNDTIATVHRMGCTHAQRAMNEAKTAFNNNKEKQKQEQTQQQQQNDSSSTSTSTAAGSQYLVRNGERMGGIPLVDSVRLRLAQTNPFSPKKISNNKKKLWMLQSKSSTSMNIDDEVTTVENNNNKENTNNNSNNYHKHEDVPVKLCWAEDFDYDNNGSSSTSSSTEQYLTEVVVHAKDRKLLLADCSEVVSELSEIVKTGSSSYASTEHATLVFLVKVNDLQHLQNLMDNLLQIRSVMSVERRFGSELL